MPKLRFHSSLATCLLAVALVLISTTTLLAQPASRKPATTRIWVLSQGAVVDPGKTSNTPDGALTTGFVVEGLAQSQGAKKAVSGKFTISCTIQEKGGTYYLRGTWNITKPGAAKTVFHTPNHITGAFMAELPFNPATTAGTINGKVLISPKRRHAGNTPKAVGTFAGNEKFEGTLTVSRKK